MEQKNNPTQLNEYRGALTVKQAVEGMNAAIRNAQRLAQDAKMLLDAERYPTAAALASLSIEESGKVSILRHLVGITDPKALRDEWCRYRDHCSENGAWILPDLVAKGARQLSEFADTIDRSAEHTAVLNSIKQIGFYSDCYGNIHWSEPTAIVEKGLAESLVRTAVILVPKREISVREIELWVELVAPARKTEDLPHALLRWAKAIYSEGLTDTKPEEYDKFIFGKPGSGKWVVKSSQNKKTS